jgi:hypothetical protein
MTSQEGGRGVERTERMACTGKGRKQGGREGGKEGRREGRRKGGRRVFG